MDGFRFGCVALENSRVDDEMGNQRFGEDVLDVLGGFIRSYFYEKSRESNSEVWRCYLFDDIGSTTTVVMGFLLVFSRNIEYITQGNIPLPRGGAGLPNRTTLQYSRSMRTSPRS